MVARPTAVLAASYTQRAQAADLSLRRAKTMDLSGRGVGGQFRLIQVTSLRALLEVEPVL